MRTGALLPQNLTASQLLQVDASKELISAGALAGLLQVASGVLSAGVKGIKYGTTTHDISLTGAGATQAITGFGFTPTVVILFTLLYFEGSISKGSIGIFDGSSKFCIYAPSINNASGTAVPSVKDVLVITTGNYVYANVQTATLDADGFTLTWRKTGSPTGTATLMYTGIKA